MQGSDWTYHYCDCTQIVYHQDCWHYCCIWERHCGWTRNTQWTHVAEGSLLFSCNAASKGKSFTIFFPFHLAVSSLLDASLLLCHYTPKHLSHKYQWPFAWSSSSHEKWFLLLFLPAQNVFWSYILNSH